MLDLQKKSLWETDVSFSSRTFPMPVWMRWHFSALSEAALSSETKSLPTLGSRSKRKSHRMRNPEPFAGAYKACHANTNPCSHFGPLHKHGWMPHPKNGPEEFVIVYDSKE